MHNEYYGGDEVQRQGLQRRTSEITKQIADIGKPADPKALPPGWAETAQGGQTYYVNSQTGETAWERPVAPPANEQMLAAELEQVQRQLRAVGTDSRTLTITLYLTGCKPEQLKPEANPKPGSTAELINALQATKNPNTGQPYLRLKAGRPDWDRLASCALLTPNPNPNPNPNPYPLTPTLTLPPTP